MPIFENLILLCVFLFFPLTCYLIYITYISNLDIKEKNIILDISIITSLFLIIRYINDKSIYLILFYNIPLLLAYIKEKTTTSIIISFLIVILYNYHTNIPLIILTLEYATYFTLYLYLKRYYNKVSYTNVFIAIKSFIISFIIFYIINPNGSILSNFIYLITTLTIFISFTYLSLYLFDIGEDIVNLYNILKESKKDKILYESLSKLTHELKNPIAVCKGYLEMIDKNTGLEKTSKYLPIISNEIERSLSVINDFSSLGKLKSISKEEVDLQLLLEEIIDILNPLFKKNKANIFLTCSSEIYLKLDYLRIKQVLVNILKNALEAKQEDTQLNVKIEVKKARNNIKIIIEDNGIGMDKKTLERVDEIFYTTKSNGTGLGVVLSKEIVELHKGTINYKSAVGKGTTVTITLPYN